MDENWYAVEHDVREQLRKAWIAMWRDPYLMDSYMQEALRRQHVAEALRTAATQRHLRRADPAGTRRSRWAVMQWLAQAAASFRTRRRIEGGNAEERQALAHE